MITEAGFLLQGTTYTFDLPDEIDERPELYGAISIDPGIRQIAYRPAVRETDPASNPQLVHAFNVRSGSHLVSVYRALDEPSTRVAYWKVGKGVVSTFYDARAACDGQTIDTDEGIRTVIAGVSLQPGRSGLPHASLRSPVFSGDTSDPFQRESIVFAHPDVWAARNQKGTVVPWPLIQIWNEPTFVRRGSGVWTHDELSGRSMTNELNITVEVQGPTKYEADLQRHANRIAASAVPVD
jgi:hypothetical protein